MVSIVFDCRRYARGKVFDIIVSENDEILICLHKWGEHHHPTMTNPSINPRKRTDPLLGRKNMDIYDKMSRK